MIEAEARLLRCGVIEKDFGELGSLWPFRKAGTVIASTLPLR